jgi:hypothetical protein
MARVTQFWKMLYWLADDSIKHALGKVSNVMVELHMTFVHVDFIIMDMGNETSSPIIVGRPFFVLQELSLIRRKAMWSFSVHTKSVCNTSQGRGTRQSTSSLMSFTHLNYQVSKPSYMVIKKALYGRQTGWFCVDFYLCPLSVTRDFFVFLLEFLIKCQVLLILDCWSCQKLMKQKFLRKLFSVKTFSKLFCSSNWALLLTKGATFHPLYAWFFTENFNMFK